MQTTLGMASPSSSRDLDGITEGSEYDDDDGTSVYSYRHFAISTAVFAVHADCTYLFWIVSCLESTLLYGGMVLECLRACECC